MASRPFKRLKLLKRIRRDVRRYVRKNPDATESEVLLAMERKWERAGIDPVTLGILLQLLMWLLKKLFEDD